MADVHVSDNPAGFWSQPVTRWQFASGIVVVALVLSGVGMTVARATKVSAVSESEAIANGVYAELIPKLDEVLAELRKYPHAVQNQEQHINIPGDGMRELRGEALKAIIQERQNGVLHPSGEGPGGSGHLGVAGGQLGAAGSD